MHKIILFVILVLFTTSCSVSEPKFKKLNTKAFEEEDIYILLALRAEKLKEYDKASEIFSQLYAKSSKKEYLYRSLNDDLLLKKNELLIQRVDSRLKIGKFDAQLIRFKIIALINLYQLDEAISLSVALAAQTKEEADYLLTSEIYIKRQEFDLAVKYLESAYALKHSEKILDKMSIILYVNLTRKKEAIAHLETYSRMMGCSRLICSRLISIYSNENNIDGLLSTSLRLYKVDKSPELAAKIVQYYSYKRDYSKLLIFLEESQSNNEVLLQLYASSKSYKKAQLLANQLYKETSDYNYLGKSGIFEYKSADVNYSKELLTSVISKLTEVVKNDPQPIYLNYLGYILIDHSLDINQGMQYIDEVLKLQPNSGYYLDSKAWGYYKLGKCRKAKEIMNHVLKLEGGSDIEVTSHIEKIDKCLNKNNKGEK